jgi:hypothetical protein
MQDFLGKSVELEDYIFGGEASQLYQVVSESTDGFANVIKLGDRTSRKVFLYNFVKISKEDLTLYFMQRGYRT